MVLTLTPTGDDERLLVRSDLDDPLGARREVELWATAQGIRIPRMALRLRVVDEDGQMLEWTVVARPAQTEPTPPPSENRFATRRNERRKTPRELPEFLKLLSSLLAA